MLDPSTLPPRGKEIWDEVKSAALERGLKEAAAEKHAWRIVKMRYRKKGDRWIIRKPSKQPMAAHGRILKG